TPCESPQRLVRDQMIIPESAWHRLLREVRPLHLSLGEQIEELGMRSEPRAVEQSLRRGPRDEEARRWITENLQGPRLLDRDGRPQALAELDLQHDMSTVVERPLPVRRRRLVANEEGAQSVGRSELLLHLLERRVERHAQQRLANLRIEPHVLEVRNER